MENAPKTTLTLCPQCGEPLEAQFESCWRCSENSVLANDARIPLTTYPRNVAQFVVLLLGVAVALASIPDTRWFFVFMFRGTPPSVVLLINAPLLTAIFAGFIFAGRRGHVGLERLLFSGLFLFVTLLMELLVVLLLQPRIY